jgi:long-chain acyl-CoA synthetase
MQDWPATITDMISVETHFGRTGVKCFSDRPADLNTMVQQAVARNPEGEALVCDGLRLTYRQLDDHVAGVAASLVGLGLTKGDRIALLLANGPEFLIALLASLRIGAIAVPINVREQTPELKHILNDCGAALIVHDAAIAERLPTDADLPALQRRLSVGGSVVGSQAFETLAGSTAAFAPVLADEEETAVILYTSGTTGQPKGAMLTHLNIIHSAMHFELCMELGARERSLLAVPASHVT